MSNEHHPSHAWVIVDGIDDGEGRPSFPLPIALKTRVRTWVSVGPHAKGPSTALPVGDSTLDCHDESDGTTIISVPDEVCLFLTGDQAEQIVACMDATATLHSWAN